MHASLQRCMRTETCGPGGQNPLPTVSPYTSDIPCSRTPPTLHPTPFVHARRLTYARGLRRRGPQTSPGLLAAIPPVRKAAPRGRPAVSPPGALPDASSAGRVTASAAAATARSRGQGAQLRVRRSGAGLSSAARARESCPRGAWAHPT
eukprot:scaffold43066_cov67-Phaeocystis_antarctica.AAC.11